MMTAPHENEPKTLSDKAFLAQFEQLTLAPAHMNHQGHIRLAWLYLSKHNIDQACRLTCQGINAYANSLGARDKFHYTITDALVRIMAVRLNASAESGTSWQHFITENQDLVENALAVLDQYYSPERLFSSQAKQTAIAPDRQTFNNKK